MIMTDGDSDTLQSMRQNLMDNTNNESISCHQLRWGKQYASNFTHDKFDVIIASDVIYVEEIIKDLFDTVMVLLNEGGMFILAFVRRNVKIDLVLDYAKVCDLGYRCVTLDDAGSSEGIYIFQRKN